MGTDLQPGRTQSSGLVDVLDRVLDKGLVIAGDIKVSLAEVELLTIRVRLIICSIDKAQQIGLDWWRYDHHLAPGHNQVELEREALREQVRLLERKVESLTRRTPAARRKAGARTDGR
jgi:Gas vesicle protein